MDQFRHFKGLVLTLGILFSCVANADSASEAAAEKLLAVMNIDAAMEQSMQQMLEVQLQQNPALAPYQHVIMGFLNKHMSYESLKPDLIQIYSNSFTAEELGKLNAFYQTPVGEKTVRLMPNLMNQGAQLGVSRIEANIGELERMIAEESERLQTQ